MSKKISPRRSFMMLSAAAAFSACFSLSALAEDTIKIGLVTALSGESARAGEALTRGLTIAIDELNAQAVELEREAARRALEDDSFETAMPAGHDRHA